jgi:HEAT repeat protein
MRFAFLAALVGVVLAAGTGASQGVRPKKDKAKEKMPAKGASSMKDKMPSSSSTTTFGGKDLNGWMKDLSHDDPSRRSLALIAISQFGDDAAVAVPLIIKRIHDKDASPRAKALLTLRLIGIHKEDVPRMIEAIATRLYRKNESEAVVRYEAALTLRRFASEAKPAIPALINGTLDAGCWEIRHMCAATLWRAAQDSEHGPDPRAVTALVDMIAQRRDPAYQVKLEVITGLGAMGKPSNPLLLARVLKTLESCTSPRARDDKPLGLWAYASLVMLSDGAAGDSALSAIGRLLRSDDLELRTQAAQALGALGKRAQKRVPALIAMIEKDPEAVAVAGACNALASIGDKSEKVIDTLLEVAAHKDPNRASAGVIALVNLNANTPKVNTQLDRLRENKDLDIRLRNLIEQGQKELQKKK